MDSNKYQLKFSHQSAFEEKAKLMDRFFNQMMN